MTLQQMIETADWAILHWAHIFFGRFYTANSMGSKNSWQGVVKLAE